RPFALLAPHSPRFFLFFTAPATTEISTLSLHDALPIYEIDDALDLGGARARGLRGLEQQRPRRMHGAQLGELGALREFAKLGARSEEHTSELQSRFDLVCRLLLEKKKKKKEVDTQSTIT